MTSSTRGIVLFAHGSGSSRLSPRNRQVAQLLNHAKLATLLVDLLTPEEEVVDLQTAQLRFDIELLAKRLVGVTGGLAFRRERAKSRETRTLRWRERDSNPRSLVRGTATFRDCPPFDPSGNSILRSRDRRSRRDQGFESLYLRW